MTFSDWILVFATLSGPILAVQAQKFIERARERRNAQLQIFNDLMATRATRVAPIHVQALNKIDLEFGSTGWRRQRTREKEVVHRWRTYADHLNQDLGENPPESRVEAWSARGSELFLDLLAALSKALGYDFHRVELAKGIYHPRAHSEAEIRQEVIQRALAAILTGNRSLPMKVTEFPVSEEAIELEQKLREGLLAAVKDGAVNVRKVDKR